MDTSREGARAADRSEQQTSQPVESVSLLGELNPCGGGDPIPLLGPKLLIGRRSSCDISLRFPNVSSHHCELELINGYWHVQDLNSRNGIKINGARTESKWLMPGDILSIAKHRYEMLYSPQGDAPPPEEEDPFAKGLLEKAGLMQPTAPHRPSSRTGRPIDDESEASDDTLSNLSDLEEDEIGSHAPFPEEADIEDDDDLAMRWLNNTD